jgi:capsular exopolysaccharide synthesis family protein
VLEASLDNTKLAVGESNQRSIEIRALEREAEANRQLLATMLSRQKEILSQEDIDFQQADARVISRAEYPVEASFPKTGIIMLLVVIGSVFLALLFIMIAELMDSGFRSGEQIEAATGIASLGFVPRASIKQDSAYQFYQKNSSSAFCAAMRTLGWTLSLTTPGKYPGVVLVTSSSASEGKTTSAICLAESLVETGKTVLLVDADLRRPSVHTVTGLEKEPGLVDILAHGHKRDWLIKTTESGLSVLSTGSTSPNPTNLLASDEFRDLINDVRSEFDVVVVDSPPVMAGADTRILSDLADATIFVVRWNKTRRQTVNYCLKQLNAAGASVSGTFLTMVDTKKHQHYSYGDSDVYAGDMAKYYAS